MEDENKYTEETNITEENVNEYAEKIEAAQEKIKGIINDIENNSAFSDKEKTSRGKKAREAQNTLSSSLREYVEDFAEKNPDKLHQMAWEEATDKGIEINIEDKEKMDKYEDEKYFESLEKHILDIVNLVDKNPEEAKNEKDKLKKLIYKRNSYLRKRHTQEINNEVNQPYLKDLEKIEEQLEEKNHKISEAIKKNEEISINNVIERKALLEKQRMLQSSLGTTFNAKRRIEEENKELFYPGSFHSDLLQEYIEDNAVPPVETPPVPPAEAPPVPPAEAPPVPPAEAPPVPSAEAPRVPPAEAPPVPPAEAPPARPRAEIARTPKQKERFHKTVAIVGAVAGGGGLAAGALVGLAVPVAIAATVGGGFLLSSYAIKAQQRKVQNLETRLRADSDNRSIRKRLEKAKNSLENREKLKSFFIGGAIGGGTGLLVGGGIVGGVLGGIIASVYGNKQERPNNFEKLQNPTHLVTDLKINMDVLEAEIRAGEIDSLEIELNKLNKIYLNSIKYAALGSGANLNEPRNARIFLRGLKEIRDVNENNTTSNRMKKEMAREIANETINNLSRPD